MAVKGQGPLPLHTEVSFSLVSIVIPMIYSALTEYLLHNCLELEVPRVKDRTVMHRIMLL